MQWGAEYKASGHDWVKKWLTTMVIISKKWLTTMVIISDDKDNQPPPAPTAGGGIDSFPPSKLVVGGGFTSLDHLGEGT